MLRNKDIIIVHKKWINPFCISNLILITIYSLLAMIALSAVQSFARILIHNAICSMEFSLNVFTEFAEFSDKNIIILKRLLDSNSLSHV